MFGRRFAALPAQGILEQRIGTGRQVQAVDNFIHADQHADLILVLTEDFTGTRRVLVPVEPNGFPLGLIARTLRLATDQQ